MAGHPGPTVCSDRMFGPIVLSQRVTQTVFGFAGPELRRAGRIVLFVACYLALEWVSFIHPLHGIGITPWSPADGLGFAVLLLGGYRWVPAVFLAALSSSLLLSEVSVPISASLLGSIAIAAGYGSGAELLRRLPHFDISLRRSTDLIFVLAIATTVPALVAVAFVGIHAAAGIVPLSQFAQTVAQSWIGDAIGIAVFTPFVLVVKSRLTKRRVSVPRNDQRFVEIIGQIVGVVLAVVCVFGPVGGDEPFKFFYILFLPLIWIAARQGLVGAVWGVLATQAGLIVALRLRASSIEDVRAFQLLMSTLAGTTLLLGVMVSERRRALGALSESEKRLTSILDAVPDGVITIDTAERIQSINPAVERLFGTTRDHLLGRSVRDFISDPGIDDVLARATSRCGKAAGEFIGRRLDDTTFAIELSTASQQIDDQPHRILVLRDITLRRQAETRAQAHQIELARVSRVSIAGQMASALAHELNQPLTAVIAYVRGCLRLLRQQSPQLPLLREGLDEAVHQAERAGLIINRLREFLYDGISHQAATGVLEIVDAALDLARPELIQHGIDTQLRIAPDLPRVLVDPIQIEQVLLNLVRNAMEAMTSAELEQPRITITINAEGPNRVRIAVSDVGPGVADDVASRLFQPFTTTKLQGMGLGLSISRSILQAHGGELEMIRNPGGGATFSFTLPGDVGHERQQDSIHCR
jgi:PAS domain S-box-containing protein